MKAYLKKIKSYFVDNNYKKQLLSTDIKSFQNLLPLIYSNNYVPFNELSLRPFALNFLCNEILINRRSRVIEFGSGVSTILMARLIKQMSLETRIVSIDEHEGWLKVIEKSLKEENLSEYVNLIHSPVQGDWYNEEVLKQKLRSVQCDLVFVDGPTSGQQQHTRYKALPFVFPQLADEAAIFLDDVDRAAEKEVLERWEKEFELNFRVHNRTLGVAYRGQHFTANPNKGFYDHFLENYNF